MSSPPTGEQMRLGLVESIRHCERITEDTFTHPLLSNSKLYTPTTRVPRNAWPPHSFGDYMYNSLRFIIITSQSYDWYIQYVLKLDTLTIALKFQTDQSCLAIHIEDGILIKHLFPRSNSMKQEFPTRLRVVHQLRVL
jgi:hypothetical protein